MTPAGQEHDGDQGPDARERRRRLEEIFGEVLPSQSRDDRDEAEVGQDRASRERAGEDRLLRDVPPHHGS